MTWRDCVDGAFEPPGSRIDRSVVVIQCAFSINLTALTLEEVLGKRRKVVADMCAQLRYGKG